MGNIILKVIWYGAAVYAAAALYEYVIFPMSDARCKERWSPSKLNAEWRLNGGCTVNLDGAAQWVPEASVQISPKRK